MDAESRLTLAYFKSHPIDASRLLEAWSAEDIIAVMEEFPPEVIAPVLEFLSPSRTAEVLDLLPQEKTVAIIARFPSASAIRLLRLFEPHRQRDLLTRLDQTLGPSLRLSMDYPDGTAASLADPRVTTLSPDISVADALDRIKHDPAHATYYHYVVNRAGILVGLVTTKELLVADPRHLVATVMNDQFITVSAEATEAEVLQNPHWRLYHTLPVVDREGNFLGALRYRTLRRVEERSSVKSTAGPLPQTLLQMWEAYALIGLRIMTDLAQAIEVSTSENHGTTSQKGEAPHGFTPDTP